MAGTENESESENLSFSEEGRSEESQPDKDLNLTNYHGDISPSRNHRARKYRARNHRDRWIRRLALASVVTTFGLIVLGGLVRVTGSGLGCAGEWPLCDGSLIPPMTKEDIIEYSHRFVASIIVGPLIMGTFLVALFRYRKIKSVILPAAASVALLLAQGGLGGVTVLTELPGHIVAAHLLLAQTIFGCVILVAVSANRIPEPASGDQGAGPQRVFEVTEPPSGAPSSQLATAARKDGFPRLAIFAATATFVLLLSGAYVTATPGALAACPQWPMCAGSFWPETGLQTIHMLHRLVAALVGLVIVFTMFRAMAFGPRNMESGGVVIMLLSGLAGSLLFAQIIIGAIAIWGNFPVEVRLYHIALATAIWGLMAAVALLSNWQPTEEGAVFHRELRVQDGGPSAASMGAP